MNKDVVSESERWEVLDTVCSKYCPSITVYVLIKCDMLVL